MRSSKTDCGSAFVPRRRRALAALSLALAIGGAATAHAQRLPGQALDAADQAVLSSYTLTEQNVAKLTAVQGDASAHHVDLKLFDAQTHSIDAAARELDAQPGAHALLAAHGLTAREGVLTGLAAASAMMTVRLANTPYAAKLDSAQVNPANVAFARRHMAEFGPLLGH